MSARLPWAPSISGTWHEAGGTHWCGAFESRSTYAHLTSNPATLFIAPFWQPLTAVLKLSIRLIVHRKSPPHRSLKHLKRAKYRHQSRQEGLSSPLPCRVSGGIWRRQ